MKKIIGFFAGLAIIALTLAAVFTAARIYDYSNSSKINPVLLQPDNLRENRIEPPIPLEKLSDRYILNLLVAKFAAEYMRVIPNEDELRGRAAGRGALALMCGADALAKWRRDEFPAMEKMAMEKKRRAVSIGRISKQGDYLVVPFATKTWNNPNRLDEIPSVSSGKEMYMRIRFNKKVRRSGGARGFDAARWLDGGLPPAAIFEFIVDGVEIK
jgi:hypothetical protein